MENLFGVKELEDFYEKLNEKELLKILELGAVLGFSVEERFLISFGSLSNRGEHEWLDRKKMMMVDISVFDAFYDERGRLLVEEEPNAEDVREILLFGTGGVIDKFDTEFERLSY